VFGRVVDTDTVVAALADGRAAANARETHG
jgi:hypothetical protein